MAKHRTKKNQPGISVPAPLPVRDASKQDLAVQTIRNLILSQDIRSDERLTEEGIERRTHLGRSPIRYALAILEHEGLVRIEPRQDTRVRAVGLSEFDKILGLRFAVETLVAAALAGKPATEHAPLVAIHEEMTALVRGLSPAASGGSVADHVKCEFANKDIEFHAVMARQAGYFHAESFLRDLHAQARLFAHPKAQTVKMMRAVLDEHGAILTALRAGNAVAARAAVKKHIAAAAARWSPCHEDYVAYVVQDLMGISPPAEPTEKDATATDLNEGDDVVPEEPQDSFFEPADRLEAAMVARQV